CCAFLSLSSPGSVPLSLHGALPISPKRSRAPPSCSPSRSPRSCRRTALERSAASIPARGKAQPLSLFLSPGSVQTTRDWKSGTRSEEHTSELQSRFDLVCRLLLEKK